MFLGKSRVDQGWIQGGSRVDQGSIKGGSRVDPGRVWGGSRVDPGWIQGGSRADPRWIQGGSRGGVPPGIGLRISGDLFNVLDLSSRSDVQCDVTGSGGPSCTPYDPAPCTPPAHLPPHLLHPQLHLCDPTPPAPSNPTSCTPSCTLYDPGPPAPPFSCCSSRCRSARQTWRRDWPCSTTSSSSTPAGTGAFDLRSRSVHRVGRPTCPPPCRGCGCVRFALSSVLMDQSGRGRGLLPEPYLFSREKHSIE